MDDLMDSNKTEYDDIELSIRPSSLDEYIGQSEVKRSEERR